MQTMPQVEHRLANVKSPETRLQLRRVEVGQAKVAPENYGNQSWLYLNL